MALLIWTNEFRVGVDSLDADHIVIFSLINHIDEAHLSGTDERAIGRILKVLIDRAVAHFQREEMLMKRHGFPDLEAHAGEHRKIIEDLQILYEAYVNAPSAAISGEIVKVLSAWLEEHVLETDMCYRPYIPGEDT
ncbi:MAG: hemerythrin family protein [Rhodospirillales bacterium]|nr:hemerythrin family protein [Alphaproteobacteria bacterium]MBL6948764.1 hemerythrin family protein [Rhodospirillales bacterium]